MNGAVGTQVTMSDLDMSESPIFVSWEEFTQRKLPTAENTWVHIGSRDFDRFIGLPRIEQIEVAKELATAAGVVTDHIEQLIHLVQLVPRSSAKFNVYRQSSEDGDQGTPPLASVGASDCKMVVHVNRILSPGESSRTGIHQFFEEADGFQPDRPGQHWLPIPNNQRDENGRANPRNLAWHLVIAAECLGASIIMTDNVDVMWSLLGHKTTGARMVLDFSDMVHHSDLRESESGVRDLAKVLQERQGRILVSKREVHGRVSRLIGDELSETLVLMDDVGASGLERLVLDLCPMVRLTEETHLLIAGHDYKFLGELVGLLRQVPRLRVSFDQWSTQTSHDVKSSTDLLDEADVILCEFASHNAIWYSWHKRPGQRLIVHFHGYELFQDWVHDINESNVDQFVFVSEFYRRTVIEELGWPAERTTVIPNMIDTGDYRGTKMPGARFHLGLAGYVPILKRPDRALDLLELLLKHDNRYVLHLRGRNPWEYPWAWRQPAVQDAYMGFYERLTDNPELLAHVSFDPFGPDMGQWFRRIGWMLSPSTRETFHLAPVEGQASGAVPVVWDREGAVEVFSEQFVHADTLAAAQSIIGANQDVNVYERAAAHALQSVERFDITAVSPMWADVLFSEARESPRISRRFDRADMLERFEHDGSARDLDRLILLDLLRDEDLNSAEQLLAQFPGSVRDLSNFTRDTLRDMHMDRTFRRGDFVRPSRCPGVAYQPCHGSALFVREDPDPETVPTDAVQIIADAVIRQARVERPSALAVEPRPVVAWGAVVAARRLGVPVILVGEHDQNGWLPPADEFDGAVTRSEEVASEVVEAAVAAHARHAKHTESMVLRDLTVGMIADEFTERTISGRCRVIRIPRRDGYLTVAGHDLDVLFVESAWSGHDKQWFHGVAYYKNERDDIERIIATARAKNVPVIFWNKEDPVHFRSFAPTAALCDAVYTTDADRIPAYLELGDLHPPATVASMPFYAEPTLHHPLPGTSPEIPTISYAGTYYGARYAERSEELDGILGAAAQHGLTIYDRQINIPNSPYHFPERYDEFIEGGLSYDEVLEAYKAHPVHINVNSVNDSPTMFSRRVVEIAASGSVVVSGRGRGVSESLPAVAESDDPEILGTVMKECLEDRSHWRRTAWAQLRAVRRSYLAEHALAVMFRGAGIPVRIADETAWSAVVDHLTLQIATNLVTQTHPPVSVTVSSADDAAMATLNARGIPVLDTPAAAWVARWDDDATPTWAEDLMHAARFVPEDVSHIGGRTGSQHERGLMTWDGDVSGPVFSRASDVVGRTLIWLLEDREQEIDQNEYTEETND